MIAPHCNFIEGSHEYRKNVETPIMFSGNFSDGPIIIEDDVWIGANTVLLDGAILRHGCVIGAASLVRSEVQAYSINVGNPLRLIRYRE